MGRKCEEILSWMNKTWPEQYAMSWDNVGLLAGKRSTETDVVYIALDATEDVIADAKRAGAKLLITHHPLIFGALKKVNEDSSVARRVLELLSSGMTYYATHTSFDIAPGGMADTCAEIADIFERDENGAITAEPLEATGEDPMGNPVGVGKSGALKAPMTIRELAQMVKERFGLPAVLVYADDSAKIVQRAAISPGSGKSMAAEAMKTGAEVLITGDMGHHDGIDLVEDGIALIDAGHYGLEHVFIKVTAEKLRAAFPDLSIVEAPVKWPYEVI